MRHLTWDPKIQQRFSLCLYVFMHPLSSPQVPGHLGCFSAWLRPLPWKINEDWTLAILDIRYHSCGLESLVLWTGGTVWSPGHCSTSVLKTWKFPSKTAHLILFSMTSGWAASHSSSIFLMFSFLWRNMHSFHCCTIPLVGFWVKLQPLKAQTNVWASNPRSRHGNREPSLGVGCCHLWECMISVQPAFGFNFFFFIFPAAFQPDGRPPDQRIIRRKDIFFFILIELPSRCTSWSAGIYVVLAWGKRSVLLAEARYIRVVQNVYRPSACFDFCFDFCCTTARNCVG